VRKDCFELEREALKEEGVWKEEMQRASLITPEEKRNGRLFSGLENLSYCAHSLILTAYNWRSAQDTGSGHAI
jgi:hypothetical protein